MSPFGGDTQDPVWRQVDPRQFLTPGQQSTRWQAALRLAFALPEVQRVAVGVSTADHLAELVRAGELTVNAPMVASYRQLLQRRSASATCPAARSAGSRNGSPAGSANSGTRA